MVFAAVKKDGASFWRKVSQGEIEENCLPLQTGEKPIIEYPDGKVVSFKRYSHEIDGKTVYEIVATNVTERYRLTKELEQKLDELKAVNKRLVAYGDNVVELTKEKEFLAIDYNVRENPSELDAVEEFGYALLKVVDDSVSKYLAPPITSYTHS